MLSFSWGTKKLEDERNEDKLMSKNEIENKLPIYKLKTGKEIKKYYDVWTEDNNYNKDMLDWDYSAPRETVSVFIKYNQNNKTKIFDAGCGTGLVGIELKKNGYNILDGADFSQSMIKQVPKNLYQNLYKIDLNKKILFKDNTYDAIICVGTFTYGHVHPPALDEMTRICKNGGNISFTINVGIYEEYGFDKKIKEMEKNGILKIKEFFMSDYIKTKGVNAWLCLTTVRK